MTQRVHYTNSGMLYVQPRNGINLCGITPGAPVGLIFSMHTDKEGRDMSRMKSKMLKSFVTGLLLPHPTVQSGSVEVLQA